MCDHLFVVTGGPGAGKTSLLQALADRGLRTMPEAGRAIIRDQSRIGGRALPWDDRAAYAELMLGWEMRSHHEAAQASSIVVLDRGVPDVAGYLTLCGLPVPRHVERAAELFRYNRTVFLAPYWDEIFVQDSERKQDRAEAEATCRVLEETYARLGYDLVPLPFASVEERADFVMRHLPGRRAEGPGATPAAS